MTCGAPHLHWACAAVFFCKTACMHSLFPGTASLCQPPWWRWLWSRSSQTSGYPAVRQEERPWETAKKSHHNMSSRVMDYKQNYTEHLYFSFKILQDFLILNKPGYSHNTCSLGSGSLVSAGDKGPEWLVSSAGLVSSVTGLGVLAFNATRVPFDTNMKTSLWNCRN